MTTALELSDKLPNDAHTIFVGINPAIMSATQGHYYAHPTNAFWRLLTEAGITPRRVTAEDDDWLSQHGFGFTDVAKRPTVGAGDLANHEYHDAQGRIKALAEQLHPHTIAFISKTSARAFLRSHAAPIKYGLQDFSIAGSNVWFMPSTSGQSYRDTTYAQKLEYFKALAEEIANYHEWPANQ